MPNPGKTTFCLQIAAMEGAVAASHLAATGAVRLLLGQQTVFGDRAERRQTRKALEKPCANSNRARLEDHYGRRNHDVDVERL